MTTSSTYYQAILQNLFFATLNQRMGKDAKGQPYRCFAKDEGFQKNRATYDVNNLYRYESLFREAPDAALAHFADIPFLNGGLFECLDRTEDGTGKKRYLDGFSRNPKKRPTVPNRLFFGGEQESDLSAAYGDTKRKKEKVSGLIRILNRYKFTIVENTPIDQEIALDPELLGKVFENLLASYNEETKTTARKQTGSFYTPRPIVDYMVDESLKAHLTRALVEKAGMKEPDARAGLDLLFAYTEKEHAFTAPEVAGLIAAIDALKILDPACGSGAFPMGVLHKLVYYPRQARSRQRALEADPTRQARLRPHARGTGTRLRRQQRRLRPQALSHRKLPLRRGHPAHRHPDHQAPLLHLPRLRPKDQPRQSEKPRHPPAAQSGNQVRRRRIR